MIDNSKYLDEFEFSLNESGEFTIGSNFSSLPSEILKEMDDVAYKEQFEEYVEGKKNVYPQVVYQSFPAPIAFYFHQTEHGYDNELHRLHLLRDSWESLIYILYALVLGEVNSNSFEIDDVRVFNNQKIKLNGILGDKIGYRLEVIKRVIEFDRENASSLKLTILIDDNLIEDLKELNKDRNSFSHTSALSESEAISRFQELFPKVTDVFFQCDFLEDVQLLRYVNSVGRATNVRFSRFDGHSLQKINYEKEFNITQLSQLSPLFSTENLLMEFKGNIFNVSPFIHFYQEGNQVKLCFFRKLDRNSDEYIFEIIGGVDREARISPSDLPNCIVGTLSDLL